MRGITTRQLGALLAPVLLLAATVSTAQEGPTRIAVVDVPRIVAESKAGQALQQRLEAFRQSVEAELTAGTKQLADLRSRVAQAETAGESSRLTKEFENVTIKLERLRDDKQREGQKLQQDGLRKIEKDLGPVIRTIRDEQKYDLILAKTPGLILMSSDRVDITQLVLDRFNAPPAS